MNVWQGLPAELISLGDRDKFPASIPASLGWFWGTSEDYEVQSSYNDFASLPGLPLKYIMNTTGRGGSSVWELPSLHHYVFYDEDSKRALVEHLKIEGNDSSAFSVY